MAVDGIFHHFLNVESTVSSNDVIPDSKIFEIELVANFKKLFAMDVVSVCAVDDVGITEVVEIGENQFVCGFLKFEYL